MFIGLNWSVLIVFLALAVIGLWVAYSFLNKEGLYLFCILAVVLGITAGHATMFSLSISVSAVIMPVVYLALLTCFNKFGKDEAKKLFFTTLTAMLALFVCTFFLAAYEDAATGFSTCLKWTFLGQYLSPIVAFIVASSLTLFLLDKIKIKNLKTFLQLALYIAVASVIDALLYVFLVHTGTLAFGRILLTFLVYILIVCLVSVGLGYFEKFLNREPKKAEAEKTEETKAEPAKEEPKEEEVKTPDDID